MSAQFWLELLHIAGTILVGLVAFWWKKREKAKEELEKARQDNLERLIAESSNHVRSQIEAKVEALKAELVSELKLYLPRLEFEAIEKDRARMHAENKEEFRNLRKQFGEIQRELAEQKAAIAMLGKRPAKRL